MTDLLTVLRTMNETECGKPFMLKERLVIKGELERVITLRMFG